MSTRLTERLITYGLCNAAANALADGGYWRLDTLLDTVATWKPMQRATSNGAGVELYEYLNVPGLGPFLNTNLVRALRNFEHGTPEPWAPSAQAAELVEDVVTDITAGRIEHGQPLTRTVQLSRTEHATLNTVRTAHRLLAARGYLAMRRRRPIALVPDSGDYEVRYCPSIDNAGIARVAQAVALARRHPGLWNRSGLCRGIRDVLRPIDSAEYDDARRVMTVLVARWPV